MIIIMNMHVDKFGGPMNPTPVIRLWNMILIPYPLTAGSDLLEKLSVE